jgi:phosphopantothenoylcysteine synthetase/decarboxylase
MDEHLVENLLIGMTGAISVINYAEYIYKLRKQFVKNIKIIMTKSATKFITPFSLRVISGNEVFTDTFDLSESIFLPHLQLVRNSDLFLIMPATANMIGKLAHGICDDLITTCAISARIPVAIVPQMNSDMYFSKANQRNIALVKELGYYLWEPKILDKEQEGGGSMVDLYQKNENPIYRSSPEVEDIVEFMKNVLGK